MSIGADGKRCVLRLLEAPVRLLGHDNTALLSLIEECPKGAETLVTRVIHILTEKCLYNIPTYIICLHVLIYILYTPDCILILYGLIILLTALPSPELVSRVRDLYAKKVPDVRFLIPVINGLTKAEVNLFVHTYIFYYMCIQFTKSILIIAYITILYDF